MNFWALWHKIITFLIHKTYRGIFCWLRLADINDSWRCFSCSFFLEKRFYICHFLTCTNSHNLELDQCYCDFYQCIVYDWFMHYVWLWVLFGFQRELLLTKSFCMAVFSASNELYQPNTVSAIAAHILSAISCSWKWINSIAPLLPYFPDLSSCFAPLFIIWSYHSLSVYLICIGKLHVFCVFLIFFAFVLAMAEAGGLNYQVGETREVYYFETNVRLFLRLNLKFKLTCVNIVPFKTKVI